MRFCIISVVALVMVTETSAVSNRVSKFRILAPQFICPKDDDVVVEKPDNTVITLQTTDKNLQVVWNVRWVPFNQPTQRFTLLLWRIVRTMEMQLNGPQPEPYVYVIDNSKLLRGVNYLFNVSAVKDKDSVEDIKTFNIDNTHGDNKLTIEGQNDMLSIILVGSQEANVDDVFMVEAQIITCYPTQDYYFSWIIQSIGSEETIDVSEVTGSILEVTPYSLKAGVTYNTICKVIRQSNEDLITETSMPFKVLYQGLEVYLNVDYLEISVNHTFSIESTIVNHDYYDATVLYNWRCIFNINEECTFLNIMDSDVLTLSSGLPDLGIYTFLLTVTVSNETSIANATVVAVSKALPVIQINAEPRIVNEGTMVSLVANATDVAPACNLSWYFASKDYLESDKSAAVYCEHGELLTDTVTIYSLEEQFLSELTDFTNETEWRQITASTPAASGRARFYAQCGCSLTFGCDTQGSVYADIWLKLNTAPAVKELKISPTSGKAMETLYRISTLAATDSQGPLRYSFFSRIWSDQVLLLATYFEFRAVETFLPYIICAEMCNEPITEDWIQCNQCKSWAHEDCASYIGVDEGTDVWVEVCDSLSACSKSEVIKVVQEPGEGLTMDMLLMDASAHARRCEIVYLRRVVVFCLVTYTNADQPGTLLKFTKALHVLLSAIDNNCVEYKTQDYLDMFYILSELGIDTTKYK